MASGERYIDLTDKFMTGVPEMDREHQQLVDLINRMYQIFQNKGSNSEILQILDELLSYGVHHFADEEAYMKKVGISGLNEHIRIHKELVRQATEIRDKLKSGQVGVGFETFKFLQNWLMNHIAGTDVKSYGNRGSATELKTLSSSGGYDPDWLFQLVTSISGKESFVALYNANGIITHIRKVPLFPFPLDMGSDIKESKFAGMVSAKAFKERRAISLDGDTKLYGFPYHATTIPIITNGEFQGMVSVVVKVTHLDAMANGIEGLSDQVGILNTLSHDMANASTAFAQNIDAIATAVNQLNDDAKALVEINNLVSEVAAQTNLLGLNAAIEAARAGELGRGFGVVADEIRRLSQMVKDSSRQVNDKVNEITREISHIQEAVQESMANSQEQAAQLQELSATVTHVHESTQELQKIM